MARIEKIDENEVRECLSKRSKKQLRTEMQQLQLSAYVMCGGGFIGRSAAEQPDGFYIDSRVAKRPYHYRHIYNVVAVIRIYRDLLGLKEMPALEFNSHNCGVW